MNKSKKQSKRSWFTTILASIIGLVILGASSTLIPIKDLVEALTFGTGILLAILCALVAFQGKKGTIKDILYSLTFWK